MKYPVSGIILAGGVNSRFGGENKAFIEIRGKRIIENIYTIFESLFEQIIIVTNEPEKYVGWDAYIVSDIFGVKSSLTGIHSGLFYAGFPFAFIAGCDMPFLKKDLVEAVIKEIEPRFDIIIPETSAGFEPLCAVYSKRLIGIIESMVKTGRFSIRKMFNKVKTKSLSEKFLRMYDSDLASFFNINSPAELVKANAILDRSKI